MIVLRTSIIIHKINTVLLVKELVVNNTDERIPLIEDEIAEISIPSERKRVRVASLLLRNMSGLLPERLEVSE